MASGALSEANRERTSQWRGTADNPAASTHPLDAVPNTIIKGVRLAEPVAQIEQKLTQMQLSEMDARS